MIKLVFCARRRSNLTPAEFSDYWQNRHGPLFQKHAHRYRALRYVQSHTLNHPINDGMRTSRGSAEPYDGVGEIWWRSIEDFLTVVRDPSMADLRRLFVEDESRFVDLARSAVFFTEEVEFPLPTPPAPAAAEDTPDPETIRSEVRRRYGSIASGEATLKSSARTSCCGTAAPETPNRAPCGCGSETDEQARTLGYTEADIAATPAGANLGLGCGNPVAIASLQIGQTVLDLGAGAGFDAFLAARAVGPSGRVIGVDMTPEMVAKARANAARNGFTHVEFRLGEIEALPVADGIVDVIISNCVINLCPDKCPVYREAFRVLKPGGRIAVSDVVAREELPDEVKRDLALHSGCLAGATPLAELAAILRHAGFVEIVIRPKSNSAEVIESWDAVASVGAKVFAAEVLARKPAPDDRAPARCCCGGATPAAK